MIGGKKKCIGLIFGGNSNEHEIYQTTNDKEICLIKTCWLKIFQRVCKKKIQKRLLIYQKRKHPKSIMYRQIHGKWKE